MVTEIIGVITAWINGFWTFISASINEAIQLFWNSTDSALTPVGILALFGVGVGVVYLGLNFVRGFFQK